MIAFPKEPSDASLAATKTATSATTLSSSARREQPRPAGMGQVASGQLSSRHKERVLLATVQYSAALWLMIITSRSRLPRPTGGTAVRQQTTINDGPEPH